MGLRDNAVSLRWLMRVVRVDRLVVPARKGGTQKGRQQGERLAKSERPVIRPDASHGALLTWRGHPRNENEVFVALCRGSGHKAPPSQGGAFDGHASPLVAWRFGACERPLPPLRVRHLRQRRGARCALLRRRRQTGFSDVSGSWPLAHRPLYERCSYCQ